MVAVLVRMIFAQADAEANRGQLRQVVTTLGSRFPKAAALLADAERRLPPWLRRCRLTSPDDASIGAVPA
jgi:hypothetical protein